MRRILLGSIVAVPIVLIAAIIYTAIITGDTGLKLEKTQTGFLVSEESGGINNVRPGDLIISVHGLSYHKILGSALNRFETKMTGTATIRSNGEIREQVIRTVPYTLKTVVAKIWYILFCVLIFVFLGSIAFWRAPQSSQAVLFFLMLCGFSTSLAGTLASNLGILVPRVQSISFLILAVSNWISFGLWAHFALRFPISRDIIEHRRWIPFSIYMIPAVTTIFIAFSVAGVSMEFWGWAQRLRNMYIPIIIIGVFIKHVLDYRFLTNSQEKNQVKLIAVTYWLTFTPYLCLYLIPILLIDRPLIPFKIAVIAFFILPVAYLTGIFQYRFLNIDRFISRALAYFALSIGLLILYSILMVGVQKWFSGHQASSNALFVVFLLSINIVFHPLIERLDRVIKNFFFRYQSISAKNMQQLSRKISSSLCLQELTRLIKRDLPETIRTQSAGILPIGPNIFKFLPEYKLVKTLPCRKSSLINLFRKGEMQYASTFQTVKDLSLASELIRVSQLGFSLVLPLRSSRSFIGLLLIGPKTNGQGFQEEEMLLLSSYANQTAVALENAVNFASLVESKQEMEKIFEQKIQAEKLATIGKMTAMLAHELKNPLGIIHGSAQYLLEGKQSGAVTREMLSYIKHESEHLSESIESVLKLSRQKRLKIRDVDLRLEVPCLVEHWCRSNSHRNDITIRVEISDSLPFVQADFKQLGQVLLNLIRNSEEAMTCGGEIKLNVREENRIIRIEVKDRGPGIPDKDLGRIFENFFTTREDGLGLGLAICKQIIDAHHGKIALQNRDGTVACIRLPVKQPAAL